MSPCPMCRHRPLPQSPLFAPEQLLLLPALNSLYIRHPCQLESPTDLVSLHHLLEYLSDSLQYCGFCPNVDKSPP